MAAHQACVGAVTLLTLLTPTALALAAQKPQPLVVDEYMMVVRLLDGTLMGTFTREVEGVQETAARYSTDNGMTWGAPEALLRLPKEGGAWAGPLPLADSGGEVHLFYLKWDDVADADKLATEGVAQGYIGSIGGGSEQVAHGYLGGYGGKLLNVWHTRSDNGRKSWRKPRLLWMGYTGAMNSVIQMANGRILFPFAELRPPRDFGGGGDDLQAYTKWGPFQSTLLYSDDWGATWHLSPSSLGIEVPSIIHGYGADEPVVLQLKDGRVWMLVRTQRGRLFQSFSDDGATWSPLSPTNLISSDSPAGIVRLDDGRIVLFWNCCQRYPYAFGGRHVLHAAISSDEGKTWRGFREVARDPKRNEPVPPRIDFGTAYPFPTVVNDGKIIYTTGQGAGRTLMMLLDPEWLLETHQQADFASAQDEWSIFGTRGVEFLDHPQEPGAKVLSIRKTDPDWPACAVWNFPNGLEGRLRLRLMVNRRCKGALIALTDHFSTPFDIEDHVYSLFNLEVASDGALPGGTRMSLGRWHDLELQWSVPGRKCAVLVDGKRAGTLPLRRETTGVCYLRLRSTCQAVDKAGFIVEAVEATVAE
jgi:hypothetical protein